jgi:hypothetical protein
VVSYLGESGETSAVLREGLPPLEMNPATGTKATFVAPGSVTRGEFGLFRWDMPASSGGAGSHFHRGFSESFYVMFAPGIAREKYFEELAEIRAAGRTLTDEEWADLFARHDQVNL